MGVMFLKVFSNRHKEIVASDILLIFVMSLSKVKMKHWILSFFLEINHFMDATPQAFAAFTVFLKVFLVSFEVLMSLNSFWWFFFLNDHFLYLVSFFMNALIAVVTYGFSLSFFVFNDCFFLRCMFFCHSIKQIKKVSKSKINVEVFSC